jgi:uncharacterized protein (DUF2147 family)
MKKTSMLAGLAAVPVLLVLTSGMAVAQDVSGTWLRESGASRVRFSKCGEAMCGTIVWLKDADGPARIGQRVFFDMKPDGAGKWQGSAFNPEDGKNYSGSMFLQGAQLKTSGCVLGGMICRSVNWTRVN